MWTGLVSSTSHAARNFQSAPARNVLPGFGTLEVRIPSGYFYPVVSSNALLSRRFHRALRPFIFDFSAFIDPPPFPPMPSSLCIALISNRYHNSNEHRRFNA
jgi:hypothetical protein